MSGFETVIGLEVHCQLKTRSKAFCACPVLFGAPPNSLVCPVCLGYPGALPVPNRGMVALAVRVALALGCTVHERSVFARKNYFYPDLPKGYQISQFDRPLATGGGLEVPSGGGKRAVRLHRIHLEEDAGKSMHEFPWDDVPTGVSLVDLNRAGTPLIEIVTEPDLRSPDEAWEFLTRLRRLVRWLDASDGNMEEGSLRCDANVSIRRAGAEALGTKVEIKNLNSFAHVRKALEHEVVRQTAAAERGEAIVAETRLWDERSAATRPMRSKEEAMDYRYFPEPDLAALEVDARFREEARRALPELPEPRAARLVSALGLPAQDAEVLVSARPLADWFEAAAAARPQSARPLANWLLSELLARMSDADRQAGRVPLPPGRLAELVALIEEGTISGKIAKELLPDLIESGRPPAELVKERGLVQVTDEGALREVVARLLAENPRQVADYRGGKAAALGWFVGQVMKATQGRGNPSVVNRLLKEELGKEADA